MEVVTAGDDAVELALDSLELRNGILDWPDNRAEDDGEVSDGI